MRSLCFVALAAVLSVACVSCSVVDDHQITESVKGSTPVPDPSVVARDAEVSAIYALAAKKDIATLESELVRSPHDPALALALYVIEPAQYTNAFIAAYAQSAEAVNGDYGTRFQASGLESNGRRFPVSELARLAKGGSAPARAKLFGALGNADATEVPLYRSAAAWVVRGNPTGTLTTIAGLDPPGRIAAIGDHLWCDKSLGNEFFAQPVTDPTVAATLSGIRQTHAGGCYVEPARPRARASRKKPRHRHAKAAHHGKHPSNPA